MSDYSHYGFKIPMNINRYANWEIVEAYKMSGRAGRPRKSHINDIEHFKDKEFGRLWIEANSIEDPDARSFALESLVVIHQHRESITININTQLAGLSKSMADVGEAAKDLKAGLTSMAEVMKRWQTELGRGLS